MSTEILKSCDANLKPVFIHALKNKWALKIKKKEFKISK